MTWTTPDATMFETDDVLTQSNIETYLLDNLLAVAHPYDYAPSDTIVTNTTNETSIYSKTITGGDLGINGVAELVLLNSFLYNASGATLTWRVKFGGSTVLAGADSSANVSSLYRPALARILVCNRGAANTQAIFCSVETNITLDASTGLGAFDLFQGAGQYVSASIVNFTAVDTTADQTLQVTVQWGSASTNLSWRKHVAGLHLGRN